MARWSIDGATLLDPESPGGSRDTQAGRGPSATRVVIDGDRIETVHSGEEGPASVPSLGDMPRHDARGLQLAPGFIDLHFHGELLFAGPETFASALERASADLARHGTTSFLATTVAWEADRLVGYVTRLVDAMTHTRHKGARPLGLHLEGPWISPDAAGAQPSGAIRSYRAHDEDVLTACGDLLKMVTLAPELEGADALIDALNRRCVIPALGHSRVGYDAAAEAFRRGMTHVTHLFNAMSGLHHREPGLAGAVLGGLEGVSCDLICDGVHVAPPIVRVASRCLGERLCLISDRIDLPPERQGTFGEETGLDFGSGDLVDDGQAWRLSADGRLAGSRLTLDRAIRNACAYQAMDPLGAIASVTLRPARLLGIEDEIGTLRPGSRADLVLLDGAGEVVETWVGGECVYSARDPSTGDPSARVASRPGRVGAA